MGPLLIVLLEPCLQVRLKCFQCVIEFLTKRARDKSRSTTSCGTADSIGLRMPDLRPRVVDVLDREIQFIFMPLGAPQVLSASVGEHPIQRDLLLFEEWQHPITEEIGSRDGRPPDIKLFKADLTVGIDKGLLVAAADTFEGPDVEVVLGSAVAGTLTLKFRRVALCLPWPFPRPRLALPSAPVLLERPSPPMPSAFSALSPDHGEAFDTLTKLLGQFQHANLRLMIFRSVVIVLAPFGEGKDSTQLSD
jgi:hypothetical protein